MPGAGEGWERSRGRWRGGGLPRGMRKLEGGFMHLLGWLVMDYIGVYMHQDN